MEMNALVIIISTFCQFKNSNISQETKEICMEKFVNCAVIEDGKTTEVQVKKCKEVVKL